MLFDTPVVAGAVLQTELLFIHLLGDQVSLPKQVIFLLAKTLPITTTITAKPLSPMAKLILIISTILPYPFLKIPPRLHSPFLILNSIFSSFLWSIL